MPSLLVRQLLVENGYRSVSSPTFNSSVFMYQSLLRFNSNRNPSEEHPQRFKLLAMQFTRFLKAMFVLTDLLISSVPASAAEQSIQSQPSITGSAVVLGPPAATESPKFDYTFELIFKGGKCTVAQQRKLRVIFNNVAGLADRVELWKKDAFFEWSDDVDNWFGSDSSKNVAYIKSV